MPRGEKRYMIFTVQKKVKEGEMPIKMPRLQGKYGKTVCKGEVKGKQREIRWRTMTEDVCRV
jgi:hypothetical protein